ncbi:MAG: chromosomal replication initiator protein [Chlamydiales bacterium]|jgi:chromosomal replication initiator protein
MIDAHGPTSEPAAGHTSGSGAAAHTDYATTGTCTEKSDPGEPVGLSASEQAEPAQLWAAFQEAVLMRIRPEQFETWFRRAALTQVSADHVVLSVQNGFALSWLETHYRGILEESARTLFGNGVRLDLAVDAELTVPADQPLRAATPNPVPADDAATAARGRAPNTKAGKTGYTSKGRSRSSDVAFPVAARGAAQRSPARIGGVLDNSDFVLNDQYTFDNFVVGPCNRFAHAAAMGASESPGTYNPFFLHGPVGLGKTHLLQSICFSILEGWPDSRILYLSCETFVNHFIHALQDGNLMEFRNKYRNVDVLVVDDVHLLANKERTQEEFFHTFNTLYNAGKMIVLSSDSPPVEIPTLQERLVSRFKWGMVTEVEKPCFETRMAIVMRKGLVRGHEVPNDVAKLVAERIQSNVRELEGAVTRLIGYASLTKQPITVDLARVALRDIFVQRCGQPTMDDIVRVVTDHFHVKLVDLQSKSRTSSIVFPRQIAMHLARRITTLSLGEIGGHFGGRDHSTVLYAIDKIEKLSAKDSSLLELLQNLLASLETPAN